MWWLITAQQSVLHKCSQKSLLFEKLCNCHRAQSRKEIKQHRLIHPSFPREKLTKVYGNIGIFFSRWRLTLQRRREKWHVNSGEGCIERRGETVRGVCQRVFVDAAVCGAGRPEGGGHSWGGFALSEEGVQKVTCVWGVQALSGNIKHRSSNPLITFLQSVAGAKCSSVTEVSLLTSLNVVHGWFLWQHVISSAPPSRRSARSTPHDTWKKALLRTRC